MYPARMPVTCGSGGDWLALHGEHLHGPETPTSKRPTQAVGRESGRLYRLGRHLRRRDGHEGDFGRTAAEELRELATEAREDRGDVLDRVRAIDHHRGAQPVPRVIEGGTDLQGVVPWSFWTEWVVAQDNKPAEREAKLSIYKHHLGPMFGAMRLDEIHVGAIN